MELKPSKEDGFMEQRTDLVRPNLCNTPFLSF
jgi:hypothetical protein